MIAKSFHFQLYIIATFQDALDNYRLLSDKDSYFCSALPHVYIIHNLYPVRASTLDMFHISVHRLLYLAYHYLQLNKWQAGIRVVTELAALAPDTRQ
jgi:hypothetical protein